MYELEKAFWDERGKGARFRMTTIGQEYFNEKVLPILDSAEIEKILPAINKVLEDEGIVADLSHEREDRLLRVQVKGCIHRQVEERMVSKDIEPFTCVPANLIVLAIENKLDIPVELAEIKVEEGLCKLLLVLFEKRPVLA
ncbi:MAG: hypothetical protein AB1894_02745 [Chloroflexota bacterium]